MAQPARPFSAEMQAALPAKQVDVLKVIGFLQLQHGEPADAVVLFDALRALFPGDQKIALSLALAWLRAGDPRAALAILDDASNAFGPDSYHGPALQTGTLDPCHHLLRGQALAALGRMAEAARAMRLFIRQRRIIESRGEQ